MSSSDLRMHGQMILATLVMILGATAFAAEPPNAPTEPSKEMREKMATMHEQMAACLRSDKPIAECHKEAMKSHEEMMGKDVCPMMEKGQAKKPSGT
jgi:hypothetical protein